MAPPNSKIPQFRDDGYLPEGLHLAPVAEVTFRFGASTPRRRRLALRLRRWFELAGAIGAKRLLIDGSFVTAKQQPNDIDAVILLPADFEEQVNQNIEPALELEQMLLTRCPEEIFAAEERIGMSGLISSAALGRPMDGGRGSWRSNYDYEFGRV